MPLSLPQDPCPVAWERESTQETARGAAGLDYRVPRQWKPTEEAESSTPQSSVMISVVVVDNKKVEKPAEASRTRYLEKVKELDLENLECRQELAEVLGLKHMSHEDLSRHECVDWLKAHETHFSRTRMMETADLTGISMRSVMRPINYRPLKLLESPDS